MKRINLKSISNSLSNQEMKLVAGGNGYNNPMNPVDPEGGGGDGSCAANKDWNSYVATFCGSSASEAMAHAGANGHWCCNCTWASEQCL